MANRITVKILKDIKKIIAKGIRKNYVYSKIKLSLTSKY